VESIEDPYELLQGCGVRNPDGAGIVPVVDSGPVPVLG
jgi:hypothetical protein